MIDRTTQEELLVTALEGGSNYWYQLGNLKEIEGIAEGEPTAIRIYRAVMNGRSIPVFDAENPTEKLGEISRENIRRGEKTMLEKQPEHFRNILSDNWDAETADVWFQFVVMNELVFG